MDQRIHLGVCAQPARDPRLARRADALARNLNLPRIACPQHAPPDTAILLVVTESRLELRVIAGPDPTIRSHRPVAIDLTTIDTRSGPGRSLKQPLAKAVGLRKGDPHRPRIIDATAGLGENAWLLASLGCPLLAVERSPIVAALLHDALHRAAATDPDTAQRITLLHADSRSLLQQIAVGSPPDPAQPFIHPDVVYLDPMFPARRKTAERKPMKVLRLLVGSDEDSLALLPAARALARRRVVVKRPLHAPPFNDLPPAATHKGKGFRLDVYPRGIQGVIAS